MSQSVGSKRKSRFGPPTAKKSRFGPKNAIGFMSNSTLNARIRKVARNIGETKTVSSTGTAVTLSNATGIMVIPFPNIANGSEINDRVGNSVNLVKIQANMFYHSNGNGVADKHLVRELLLRVDAGRYQTVSQVTNSLFEGASDTAVTLTVQDMLAMINQDGIVVMHDRVYDLQETNNNFKGGQKVSLITKHMGGKQLLFRDAGTSDPAKDRYLMVIMVVDSASAGALSSIAVSSNLRLHYKDP